MIVNFILIGLGGALGSIARYSISLLVPRTEIPLATLAVNVIGSLIIGCAMTNVAKEHPAHLLAIVGFCGGFTTFSTFSAEIILMFKNANLSLAFIYITISLITCLTATWLGTLIKFKQ